MDNIIALVLAAAILVAIPGPNVALIVARSVQHGFRAGFVTTLGTTTGVAAQLLLIAAGVAALVEMASSALLIIKWAGAAYFVWLGIRTWRMNSELRTIPESTAVIFTHGFFVAVSNPKTLGFNIAFLPQFVSESGPAGQQLLLLSTVYLSVLLVGDALWALFAASAKPWLTEYVQFSNRLTGGLLVGAGIGLALSRRGI